MNAKLKIPKVCIRVVVDELTAATKLRFLRLANIASENPYFAYGIAIIAVVIATLFRGALSGHILAGTPFITFFPAVVVTTFFCGLWPGVVALILSAGVCWYLFLPPFYSFALETDALVALLSFLILAGIDVAIVALLNATVSKILAQENSARLLAHELQHRTNNLLTVVQSIAHRSLCDGYEKEIFGARLQSLARTHHRLTNSNNNVVSLSEIVRSELEPFSSRTTIEGAPILLGYEQAQRFSLAIHELATNAVKYGALSDPGGKIQIVWTLTRNGKNALVRFCWKEMQGPQVVSPARQGFGSVLLKTTFTGVRLDYAPKGFGCEFVTAVSSDEIRAV